MLHFEPVLVDEYGTTSSGAGLRERTGDEPCHKRRFTHTLVPHHCYRHIHVPR